MINTQDYRTEAVCVATNPTPNSIQLDGRGSKMGQVVTGGIDGEHSFSLSTVKQNLDALAGDEVQAIVAGANVTYDANADMFFKNVAGNAWNSWFQSQNAIIDPTIEDCAVSWPIEGDFDNDGDTGAEGTVREMGGLDDNPASNASYTSGEFMIYQVNATTAYIYEKGSNKGNFPIAMSAGDRFMIRFSSGTVEYLLKKGTELILIYTSLNKPSGPLFFKGALNRGLGSSGDSAMGDVRTHKVMTPEVINTRVSGAATAEVNQHDIDKLKELGLEVSQGALYSNLIAQRNESVNFPAGTTYDYTYGYTVVLSQAIGTI